ncbi:MAG: hypothetical protein ACFB2X_12205 [Rivularia sp. (in: cyanobacteria)]
MIRSLGDVKTSKQKQIRKKVLAATELYLDGDRFIGVTTELGVKGLCLKLDSTKAKSSHKVLKEKDLHNIQNIKPAVGLLLSNESNSLEANRLIAEIDYIEKDETGQITVYLKFPDKFKDQQQPKIKQLLERL